MNVLNGRKIPEVNVRVRVRVSVRNAVGGTSILNRGQAHNACSL